MCLRERLGNLGTDNRLVYNFLAANIYLETVNPGNNYIKLL